MSSSPTPSPLSERELVITRETHVPREKLYAGWTSAELYPKWFCPKPWYVKDVQLDVRAGGFNSMIFCGPNGESFPNRGVYLEVIPNEKLVYTDKFEDPNLQGDIKVTVLIKPVMGGTDVRITQSGLPDIIPEEMCYLGWQDSLKQLAQFVELPGGA